jgi:hypothetical protein
VADPLLVGLGDAHELAQDARRERRRDLGDEVTLTLPARLVHQLPAAASQPLGQPVDHARGEAPVDEGPRPRVLGRVHVHHHAALEGELLVAVLQEHRAPAVHGEEFRVA